MKFLHKANTGLHSFGKGKGVSKAGQTVQSDLELDKLYPEKFEKVLQYAPPPAAEGAEDEADPSTQPAKAAESLGADVTEQFKDAAKQDLLVFKSGKEYHIASEDEPTVALNPAPLPTKKDVETFLKAHTPE